MPDTWLERFPAGSLWRFPSGTIRMPYVVSWGALPPYNLNPEDVWCARQVACASTPEGYGPVLRFERVDDPSKFIDFRSKAAVESQIFEPVRDAPAPIRVQLMPERFPVGSLWRLDLDPTAIWRVTESREERTFSGAPVLRLEKPDPSGNIVSIDFLSKGAVELRSFEAVRPPKFEASTLAERFPVGSLWRFPSRPWSHCGANPEAIWRVAEHAPPPAILRLVCDVSGTTTDFVHPEEVEFQLALGLCNTSDLAYIGRDVRAVHDLDMLVPVPALPAPPSAPPSKFVPGFYEPSPSGFGALGCGGLRRRMR